MTQIKVIIEPCGTKAKAVNPLGEVIPVLIGDLNSRVKRKAWRQAEDNRKVYDVRSCRKSCDPSCIFPCEIPGTEHTAEIFDENTVIIL